MTLRLVTQGFDHGAEVRREKGNRNTGVRGSTLRAIHATWKKVARGVDVNNAEELRSARIAFANKVLRMDPPIESFHDKRITPQRLGAILDAMRKLERAPSLPGVEQQTSNLKSQISNSPVDSDAAEIHHLATSAQVSVIEKLRGHLGWSATGFQAFIVDKFKGKHSSALLTPAQANSCTMILLTIAARRRIKDRGFDGKISRELIRAEIPALKRDLDIDIRLATGSRRPSRAKQDDAAAEYDRMVKGAAF